MSSSPRDGRRRWRRISSKRLDTLIMRNSFNYCAMNRRSVGIRALWPMRESRNRMNLEDLFAPEETAKALAGVRNSLHSFEEQRVALTEFQKNEKVLQEIASVLNMRLANLEPWSWPKEGIPVEIRRYMNLNDNGLVLLFASFLFKETHCSTHCRAFLEPELINAIFCNTLRPLGICTPRLFCLETAFYCARICGKDGPISGIVAHRRH